MLLEGRVLQLRLQQLQLLRSGQLLRLQLPGLLMQGHGPLMLCALC
jgi:hypothetical protein